MSAESLKRRLIPLIKGGYRDDVRCEILIHLKEHPQDEEVWSWCVATARTNEDRMRAIQQWVKFNPASAEARKMYTRLEAILETGGTKPGQGLGAKPAATQISGTNHHHPPFGSREFFRTLFVGQKSIVNSIAKLVDRLKTGENHSFFLRAPNGWGKTYLANLVLNYVDPQRKDSLAVPGRSIYATDELKPKRFLLLEGFDEIPAPEILIPLLDDGLHSFIFTSDSNIRLSETFSWRLTEFAFSEYSLMELGDIAYQRLFKKDILVSNMFRFQIARYCQGTPKEAVSYAERLALIWQNEEFNDNLGELIYTLNYDLEFRPDDSDHNFLAIWDNTVMHGISVDEVLYQLRALEFPFGMKLKGARHQLQLLAPDQRRVQVSRQTVALPPYLFQISLNPGGAVAATVNSSSPKGLVLGAHSEKELQEFIGLCGIELYHEAGLQPLGPRPQPIPPEVQTLVWERDFGRCVNCSIREDLGFDHLIPLAKGGSNSVRNIQILCESCYASKAAKIGAD